MSAIEEVGSPLEGLNSISGQKRATIENVQPEIDCGRFPIKRVAGEMVTVEADIFADGHDQVACRLLYRGDREAEWTAAPMRALGNDRWRGEFPVTALGKTRYTIEGWIDHIGTWQADLLKRIAAGQEIRVELQIGAEFVEQAADRTGAEDAARLREWARVLREGRDPVLHEDLIEAARRHPDPRFVTRYEKELEVVVDRDLARFSAWYELFPRSCASEPGTHGTFRDVENWLPYVTSMGFDVLYFPPIHPIGTAFRKGKNNAPTSTPGDVGSTWAIGAKEGGHKSIDPQLGTLADFRRLIGRAKDSGLEIAMDVAFQCTPDHPYVHQHPEWFRMRPDGTIQYAENPPKKYQDIYPFDFEGEHWRELWEELKDVVLFWIGEGVRIFRVDNPHTKTFAFWEWLIAKVKSEYPEVIFLSEAFTRPRLMYRLAKLGFTQSYTYFAWRNTKQELTDYFQELKTSAVLEYFRPNLWPNTPDILTSFLQTGGRSAFMIRLILAATLGASYGIYGPAFELSVNTPFEPGSEEYLNSEKYEIKHWDVSSAWSLKDLIARVNHIRRENPALHSDWRLQFHATDNPMLICYSKTTGDYSNIITTVVNLDPFHKQWGFVSLDLDVLKLDGSRPFQALALLAGGNYTWQGPRNYVELSPGTLPAHILRMRGGI